MKTTKVKKGVSGSSQIGQQSPCPVVIRIQLQNTFEITKCLVELFQVHVGTTTPIIEVRIFWIIIDEFRIYLDCLVVPKHLKPASIQFKQANLSSQKQAFPRMPRRVSRTGLCPRKIFSMAMTFDDRVIASSYCFSWQASHACSHNSWIASDIKRQDPPVLKSQNDLRIIIELQSPLSSAIDQLTFCGNCPTGLNSLRTRFQLI